MCLSLFVFTHYFLKSHSRTTDKLACKQNLMRNNHSVSLEFMNFGITEKPKRDCVSLYNKTGLTSKVSKETDSSKLTLSTTLLSFDPLPREPSQISAKILNCQKLESQGYITAADTIFIQIFVVGSKRHTFCVTESVTAIHGHPRSLILAPIEGRM